MAAQSLCHTTIFWDFLSKAKFFVLACLFPFDLDKRLYLKLLPYLLIYHIYKLFTQAKNFKDNILKYQRRLYFLQMKLQSII